MIDFANNIDVYPESSKPVTVPELTNVYLLESIKGFGPQKFKQLHTNNISVGEVLENPSLLPIEGKRGDDFKKAISKLTVSDSSTCRSRAIRQIEVAHSLGAHILTYNQRAYPKNVYESNAPIPVLYVRGSLEVVSDSTTVASVGSRKVRQPYIALIESFVQLAQKANFTIVSGFALGADTIGHLSAYRLGGKTICVMPSGLDRPFPPENKFLWADLLNYENATFVSEYAFGVGANSLNLRKRNKLIVSFARGVMVGQSSAKGGAMNAYKFAREQKKPVATFTPDGTEETSGNRQILTDAGLCITEFTSTDHLSSIEGWLDRLSYLT